MFTRPPTEMRQSACRTVQRPLSILSVESLWIQCNSQRGQSKDFLQSIYMHEYLSTVILKLRDAFYYFYSLKHIIGRLMNERARVLETCFIAWHEPRADKRFSFCCVASDEKTAQMRKRTEIVDREVIDLLVNWQSISIIIKSCSLQNVNLVRYPGNCENCIQTKAAFCRMWKLLMDSKCMGSYWVQRSVQLLNVNILVNTEYC